MAGWGGGEVCQTAVCVCVCVCTYAKCIMTGCVCVRVCVTGCAVFGGCAQHANFYVISFFCSYLLMPCRGYHYAEGYAELMCEQAK